MLKLSSKYVDRLLVPQSTEMLNTPRDTAGQAATQTWINTKGLVFEDYATPSCVQHPQSWPDVLCRLLLVGEENDD